MLEKLRVKDLYILSQLPFSHSIRELSRQLSLDPQNLTKRIAYIEDVLGERVMERSPSGITLNEFGFKVMEHVNEALGSLKKIEQGIKEETPVESLRFCSRAYLVDFFIDYVRPDIREKFPETFFEFMDSSPELTERAARKGFLDLAISFGDVILGDNWRKTKVGEIDWGFYVRPGHPLLNKGPIDDFEKFEVLGFSYFDSDRVVNRPSDFIKDFNGVRGDSVENSRYSIKVAQQSNSIAYLPVISAWDEIENGELVSLDVEGFEGASRSVYLHSNVDTVKMKTVKLLESSLKENLL